MEFPVFSRTIAPGYIVGKTSAVAVGEPVLIGGRTIHAGDVIVADNDGVSIIRPDEFDNVVSRAQEIKDWEDRFHAAIAEGKSVEQATEILGSIP
jgi:4-hydroxy-4-methyl-2-oxoglutarate aldolase